MFTLKNALTFVLVVTAFHVASIFQLGVNVSKTSDNTQNILSSFIFRDTLSVQNGRDR